MNMQEKVVVITGGASGIGLAAARRFAQEGAPAVFLLCQKDADIINGSTVHLDDGYASFK